VVAGWDRRRLLTLSMLWYGVFHLICTAASSFAELLPLRVITMLTPAVFGPQAAACIGLLVPDMMRGRAIMFVALGWTVGSVVGMPLAAYVGGTLGWRVAFALVGIMGLVSAFWVWQRMPDGVKPAALSIARWRETFGSRALMLCLIVSLLFAAAGGVLYSYVSPYFKARIGATPGELGLLFMWFGVIAFIGNVLLSRRIDRLGTSRAVMIAIAITALGYLVWPLGTSLALAALVVMPWALGSNAAVAAQQARLIGIAPALAPASTSLFTASLYAGQGIGASVGGWMVTHGAMDSLHWVSLVIVLASIVASELAARFARGR
jgi:predicted MFS family arabinose efflux permease